MHPQPSMSPPPPPFQQQSGEHQGLADKPPIPPRGGPPAVPQRQLSYDSIPLRNSNGE